jgi:two-component system response regulator FixJ
MGVTNVREAKVFIVDDDNGVRESLSCLFDSIGYDVESYSSGPEFLAACTAVDRPACLILDVRMPQMSGLAVQEQLAAREIAIPIIVCSAHPEVPIAVRAMKSGAVDFVIKPFSEHDLLERTRAALERARAALTAQRERRQFERRLARLTPREREVLRHLVQGKANKVIAYDLDISRKTVEVHRHHVMRKMGAASAVELATLAERYAESLRDENLRAH